MKTVIAQLQANGQVSDYKVNIHQKTSCELFFVKGKLETVRCTDTCDREVTVYVRHGDFLGDARFFIYPSTTDAQVNDLISEAVEKALLINNPPYTLPAGETGSFEVESNFAGKDAQTLAAEVSQAVFAANTLENTALNSVEVFINKHTETVLNSQGLHKIQVRYDAMVETIPTYNGLNQSVELYHQYNFSSLDLIALEQEVQRKLEEVKSRYEAVVPETIPACNVILCKQELSELFWNFADDLNYATVYSQGNLYKKDDAIQTDPKGDRISITMAGALPGCVRSAKFDADGMSLGSQRIVEGGKAAAYHGANRFGQYMGENPTGHLRCLQLDPGTATEADFAACPSLEVVSMSGLQVDFYSDYIGGEVRLAYYRDGSGCKAVTGISIAGKLSQVLNTIRLSTETVTYDNYNGPKQAILQEMNIF